MLQMVEDKEIQVLFLAGTDNNHFTFHQPCPAETGVVQLENIMPSVDSSGEVHNLHLAGESIMVFALLPHNENNPHDKVDTGDDPGE